MPSIISQTKSIKDLSDEEIDRLFELLSLEFLGVSRNTFLSDLLEKDKVVLLRSGNLNGEIVGFSTLMTLDLPINGRKVKAVFSGDTTVLLEYRTSGGIGFGIGKYFLETLEKFPEHEIYYVLISKGWRTYKVLPFFFKHFIPNPDITISYSEQSVMDVFGQLKYPNEYRRNNGLLEFSKTTQRLIPDSIDATPPQNPDSHIQFFLEKNPDYLLGTELVCVAQVLLSNIAAPLRRLLKTELKHDTNAIC